MIPTLQGTHWATAINVNIGYNYIRLDPDHGKICLGEGVLIQSLPAASSFIFILSSLHFDNDFNRCCCKTSWQQSSSSESYSSIYFAKLLSALKFLSPSNIGFRQSWLCNFLQMLRCCKTCSALYSISRICWKFSSFMTSYTLLDLWDYV